MFLGAEQIVHFGQPSNNPLGRYEVSTEFNSVKTSEVEDAPRLIIEGSAGVGPSCAFLHDIRDLRGSRSNTTTGQDRSGIGMPGRVGRPRNLFPNCLNRRSFAPPTAKQGAILEQPTYANLNPVPADLRPSVGAP